MNNKIKLLSAIVVSVGVLIGQNSFALNAETNLTGAKAATEKREYSLEEMLQYALEDELKAHAEYVGIMDKFSVSKPFSNIAEAEIRHKDALITLYETRDLSIPNFDAMEGLELPNSLSEAYDIGVEAEIENIAMYEQFLEQELDPDVRRVFTALKEGSEKHLQAFKKNQTLDNVEQKQYQLKQSQNANNSQGNNPSRQAKKSRANTNEKSSNCLFYK